MEAENFLEISEHVSHLQRRTCTLESKKFDLVGKIIRNMEGKKDKSDNIKPSTRSAKSTTSENAGKSSKNEILSPQVLDRPGIEPHPKEHVRFSSYYPTL